MYLSIVQKTGNGGRIVFSRRLSPSMRAVIDQCMVYVAAEGQRRKTNGKGGRHVVY